MRLAGTTPTAQGKPCRHITGNDEAKHQKIHTWGFKNSKQNEERKKEKPYRVIFREKERARPAYLGGSFKFNRKLKLATKKNKKKEKKIALACLAAGNIRFSFLSALFLILDAHLTKKGIHMYENAALKLI